MNARESAWQIILEFEKSNRHLDGLLDHYLRKAELTGKERKFIYNLVSGCVRHKSLLDWKASTFYHGKYKKAFDKLKVILRLALYEIDFLPHIPPHATVNEYVNLGKRLLPRSNVGLINGILRSYLREGKHLNPEKEFKYVETQIAVRYSFPEWLVKRWLSQWDVKFVEEMCAAFNDRPVFDIRINPLKLGAAEFVKNMNSEKINCTASQTFENMFEVTDIQALMSTKMLQQGFFSVQDESGYLAVRLLDPVKGERVLDVCAAPGSKYTAMLEENVTNEVVVALEIDHSRLEKIRENCIRLQLPTGWIVQADARNIPFKKLFDKIIVDAPCSGIGTIQKHPDIKWRRNMEEIFRFQELQLEILSSAAQMLKPGGEIVYSTCTIDSSENEFVIESFLQKNGDRFEIVEPPELFSPFISEKKYIRTFPHLHGMEGAFAAKLKRIKK